MKGNLAFILTLAGGCASAGTEVRDIVPASFSGPVEECAIVDVCPTFNGLLDCRYKHKEEICDTDGDNKPDFLKKYVSHLIPGNRRLLGPDECYKDGYFVLSNGADYSFGCGLFGDDLLFANVVFYNNPTIRRPRRAERAK